MRFLADKRELRQTLRRIQAIKTWQLVVLLLMVGFVALTFLRLNNVGMVERRDAVWAADEAGDDVEIQRRLYDLQRYVAAHMNTDPGRVQLEYTYKRDNDVLKAQLQQESDTNPNGNIYKLATDVCDPIGLANGWRWPDIRYVNCIQEELDKYPSAGLLKDAFQPLSTAPYYHSFASPLWSPDFAGWSVALFMLIAFIIVFRLITLVVLKIMLKYRYRKA